MGTLRVRTFLIARDVTLDTQRDVFTLGSIVQQFNINPQTHTNDRHDFAVEFYEEPAEPVLLEFRIGRVGDDPNQALRFGGWFPMKGHETGAWWVTTLESLPLAFWHTGATYAIELWTPDELIARREMPCVTIEDA
jgi:hypothetical protein